MIKRLTISILRKFTHFQAAALPDLDLWLDNLV